MSSKPYPSYLRLVDAPALDADLEPRVREGEGALLGFVDMSCATDVALETILARVQPAWVFDLRPVPYFDIGRLDRKRMFHLFRIACTSYRDVAGRLKITNHNDASLNSGAVARFLNEAMSSRACAAPIVVLVDDEDTLGHAMRILPRSLRSSAEAWFPAALELDLRRGDPDLLLRTASGEVVAFQAKPVAPG